MNKVQEEKELTKEAVLATVEPILKAHFRPEFLNRLDEILPFLPLREEQLAQIVTLQMNRVAERMQEKHIALHWDEETTHHLAKEGYDPAFGARPLKRLIQHEVVNPLSRALLEETITNHSEVLLKMHEGKITFASR
ncbi:MAG: hypothetical protein WAM28_09040, partial [Chlamydiales bacterium]